MLDEWFRDVAYNYKNMPASARTLVRQFLNFDMSRLADIFFQDQLAWGTIDLGVKRNTPIIVVQQNILNSVPEEVLDEFETMSQADSASRLSVSKKLAAAGINSDAKSVVSLRSNGPPRVGNQNSELQNLIWETASQGGASKIPVREARGSRTTVMR